MGAKSEKPPLTDGQWKGKRCFVVGGGPSLKGFDFRVLKGDHVIVVNRAYIDVPFADVFFTEDLRFIEKYSKRDDWKAFKGVKVIHSLDPTYTPMFLKCDPDLFIIEKEEERCWSKSLHDGLSYNSNSGIGALNLADILGADPIFLLGFDCRGEGRYISNYHDDYPREWRTGGEQYRNFAADFKYWVAPHLRHRRVVSVINPTFPSALEHWPTMTFQDRFGNDVQYMHHVQA